MRHSLKYISELIVKLQKWRQSRYDDAILQLELIYSEISQSGETTVKAALASTRKILMIYFYFSDFYFLLAGITLMVFTSRLFVRPEMDYGAVRPFLFIVSGLFAGLLPMLLAFATMLPHVLLKANIWGVTLVNVVLSALIFSVLQPAFASLLLGAGVAGFSQLIWPMLVFYFFAEFYMLMRINPTINYKKHVERHASGGIASFIPAHKIGPLLSLSSQDHYVEIITENGSHLERMTLKKAMNLVPEGSGLQVHRSHWVAYSAILGLEKTGERYDVLLRNGTRLPVGKSKVAEVQDHLQNR